KLVAEQIAEIKETTYEEVVAQTNQNAKRLFGIN
ncbi:MAG: hydrolase TatD, partial [Heyndrickxia sp.]